jgi:hypothetical protein
LADKLEVTPIQINRWIEESGVARDEAVALQTIYFNVAADRYSGETTQIQWGDLEIKTDRLLKRWQELGGDEYSFAMLAKEYSESTEKGRQIFLQTDLPESLWEWCFSHDRKAGDSTYVRTESGHLIALYIDGGETVMRQLAGNRVRQEIIDDLVRNWSEENPVSYGKLGMKLAM